MKIKLLAGLLCLVMLVSVGCGNDPAVESDTETDPPKQTETDRNQDAESESESESESETEADAPETEAITEYTENETLNSMVPIWKRAASEVNEEDYRALSEPYRLTIRDGKKIGTHPGAHFYTIGQRKGLGIGGRKESLFVIGTDVEHHAVFVGEGDNHPGLYRKALRITPLEIHWVDPMDAMKVGERRTYDVRIRYRQPLQRAELIMEEDGLYILFAEAQRGITAGQFAAWYDGDKLLGSGVIDR